MIYEYECKKCAKTIDVIKPVIEYNSEERCPVCREIMTKIFSPTQISMQNFEPHFNHAFGKVMHSKRQIEDHIRRENGEKGRNIVEVGNDKLKSIKIKRKEYTID